MLPIILVVACLISVVSLVPLAIRAHHISGLKAAIEKIDYPTID